MENRGALTKTLAVAGTILTWLPILTPILFTAILYGIERVLRFDYLMPAELFPLALAGGGILLWASLRARSRRGLIGWGYGLAVVLLLGVLVIPAVTGLDDGTTAIGGWQWLVVLGVLAAYCVAVAATAIGGVLLARDLFRPGRLSV